MLHHQGLCLRVAIPPAGSCPWRAPSAHSSTRALSARPHPTPTRRRGTRIKDQGKKIEGAQGAQAPVAIAPQTKPETPAYARTNPSYLNINKGRACAPMGEGAWGNRARGFPHIIQGRSRARRTASAPTESATAHPPKPWGAREFLSRDQWRPRKPATHGTRGLDARQGQGRGDGVWASPQCQACAEACAQENRGHERGARHIKH